MDTQVSLTPLPTGTVVEGYTIEQALEHEPNVLRYSARNAAGDRVVLVELFPPEAVFRDGLRVSVRSPDDQEGWQSWIRSFSERTRQLAALTHSGLVRLRQSFVANGTAYCVIEPIGGETLASVLARDGTLPEPRVRQLLLSLIAALEEAHNAGLLHGDIEPSRIRMQFDGKAILSGFATLVTPIRFKGHTITNTGTPGYAPPEHLLVQAAEQPSSDVYSLSAIAYRAICGEAPPEARMRGAGAELLPSAQAAQGRYSAALTAAIDAGLAMRAQQRPQTLAQWRQLLESEEVVAAGPARPAPKNSTPIVWMVAPAVLVLAVAGYFLVPHGQTPRPAPAPTPVVAQPAAEAEPAANAPPSAASALLQAPTLDQLAIAMLKRGQKPVHTAPSAPAARPAVTPPAASKPQVAGAPPPAGAPGAAAVAGNPAAKPPAAATPTAPAATQTAAKPPETTAPAAATAATPAAPGPAKQPIADADKKEQQALLKAAEQGVAEQAQKDAAKAAAAKQAVTKQSAADVKATQERIRRAVAHAKVVCEIPAPELSESENLVYENAIAVPGAVKQPDGSIRLPEVTLEDGSTARFSIDQQSCAHRLR